jgi:O-antigen chain-terminating methyltransferase
LRHDHAHEASQALESRLKGDLAALSELLRHERVSRQNSLAGLERRLSTFAHRAGPNGTEEGSPAAAAPEDKASLNALLETFYFLLEERYRGSRDEIKQRLTVYRKDFEAARARLGISGPVIDIGCGRGELLEVLREDGFQAVGIDQNDIQLEAARRLGLPVLHHEARGYLATLAADSVLAVTGIHIAEHIPFPALVSLVEEAARVLKKGGLVVFETPNPRNLIGGATTFHFDPTHIKPLPPEVLQILLETCGFTAIETRLLHPSDTLDVVVGQNRLDPHIAGLLFGPQDYAVLAIKG